MITLVILAKNEAGNLKKLLPTLAWAGEILVLNDQSTDKTAEIATKAGARVISHPNHKDLAAARNLALKKAKYSWVLFLDADERLPEETVDEILNVIKKPLSEGYAIRRDDVFMGKRLRFGEVKDQWLVRLGKKNAGSWQRPVHETWEIVKVRRLKQPILHYSHPNTRQFLSQVKTFAKKDAQHRHHQGEEVNLLDLAFLPLGKFLYTFFYKQGFRDGLPGLVYSLFMSYHSFLVRWFHLSITLRPKPGHSRWLKLRSFIFYLTLVFVALGQLTRIQFSAWGAVYLFEFTMAAGVILWLIQITRHPKLQLPPYGLSLIIFSLSLGLSLVFNLDYLSGNLIMAGSYWLRWCLYALFGLSIWDLFRRGAVKLSPAVILLNLGLIFLTFGFLQYLLVPDTRWLYDLGWDDHYYRMLGLILDPGFFGLLMVLLLINLERFKGKYRRFYFYLAFAALILSYARSAYLTYLIAITVYGWQASKALIVKRAGLLLLSVLIFIVLLPPPSEGTRFDRGYSVTQRAESSVNGLELFRSRPLFGIGYNAYRLYTQDNLENALRPVHPSGPDNSLVLILSTAGLTGMAAFVYFYGTLIRLFRLKPWIFASLVAILFHSLTNNSFFYPFVLIWLLIMIADCDQRAMSNNQ